MKEWARSMTRVFVVVLFLGMTAPALGQNLLLNPSFEVDENQGNAQMWFGDYTKSDSHVPTPAYVDGSSRWGYGLGGTGAVTTDTYQTVAVAVGAEVTFSGYVHVGPGARAVNTATITLRDGLPGSGTTIGDPVIVDKNSAQIDPPNDTWVYVEISGGPAVASGQVTVQVTCSLDADGGDHDGIAAVHLDHFSLTTDQPCTTQHQLDAPPGNPAPDSARRMLTQP